MSQRNDIIILRNIGVSTYTMSARYRGGPYIDLYWDDEASKQNSEPFEVINVWDYAKGKRSIEHSLTGVRVAVNGWIADLGTPRERREAMATYYANAGSR